MDDSQRRDGRKPLGNLRQPLPGSGWLPTAQLLGPAPSIFYLSEDVTTDLSHRLCISQVHLHPLLPWLPDIGSSLSINTLTFRETIARKEIGTVHLKNVNLCQKTGKVPTAWASLQSLLCFLLLPSVSFSSRCFSLASRGVLHVELSFSRHEQLLLAWSYLTCLFLSPSPLLLFFSPSSSPHYRNSTLNITDIIFWRDVVQFNSISSTVHKNNGGGKSLSGGPNAYITETVTYIVPLPLLMLTPPPLISASNF